jgi:hypothetical protein
MKSLENEHSRDWLLFQYVEGELDDAQVRQMETQLAADEALREELTLWEEAFVEDETYDTYALEARLRIADTSSWVYFRTGIGMLVVWLMASFSFPTATQFHKQHVTIPATAEKIVKPSLPATTNPAPIPLVTDLPARKTNGNILRIHPKDESKDTQPLRVYAPALPLLEPSVQLKPDSTEPATYHWQVKTVNRVAKTQPKKLTRQEQRQQMRMKEKARQQRQANEFMKGNVPYVVPLNSTNF